MTQQTTKAIRAQSVFCFTLVMLISSCALLRPPTPAEEVSTALMGLYRAERAHDLEAIVDVFSPVFSGAGVSYSGLPGYFEG